MTDCSILRHAVSLSVLVGIVGCGSSSTTTTGGPKICPPVVYTGFVQPSVPRDPDGLRFSVRVLVVEAKNPTWVTGDVNIARVMPDGESMGLIVAAGKVGRTRVTVVADNGQESSIDVNVAEYPKESQLKGEELYRARPCVGCHDSPGQSNVTSSGISDKTDDQVIAAVTMGQKPASEGGGMLSTPGINHMFPLSGDERIQLVSYLRSVHTSRPPGRDTCR